MAERSREQGRDLVTPIGSREGDVERRLRHMDRLGIDTQVVFHTLWTVPTTDRPEVELALCKELETAGWPTCGNGPTDACVGARCCR